MSGFDDPGLFFSDPFGTEEQPQEERAARVQSKQGFRNFIREFSESNFNYRYREQLRRRYNVGQYWIEVEIGHLSTYDEELCSRLLKQPSEYLPLFEDAAKEMADELTQPRPVGQEVMHDVQVLLNWDANPSTIRALKSDQMSRLVKIPGIAINASSVRAKATTLTLQCRTCRAMLNDIPVKPGLEGYMLPRSCNSDTQQLGKPKCPVDPFFIVPDKCKCVDFQVLKFQESPEAVPNGEMPRHIEVYCDRYLVEKVVPGNRVTVVGIYSIRKGGGKPKRGEAEKINVGIRRPYVRALGFAVETEGPGRSSAVPFTPEEEHRFRTLSAQPDIYQKIASSIAPSIYGSDDIKKAIAALLFGGSRKRLPDGLTRRGDINLLLLGDPGTAKSQLLKFVEKVAPVGVYTSGKGSSAAGLTASIMRDPATRNFVVEGGAMVLADGGVVCIDEFDKMRQDDRVAIHEAMEQQTISLAKAGITTTLNSRCSVLAAANSVFGRWDDTKGEENIDFMPTILSRFDMIFIIKDTHNEERDQTLARHVMRVHLNAAARTRTDEAEGELSLGELKKFVKFCRNTCAPRLSADAAEKLKSQYVLMRSGSREHELATDKRSSIPITVRQLEAVVRIAESIAKMGMQPFATEVHIDEALRLFQVSTLDAALSGSLTGVEGFTPVEDQQEVQRCEQQLKSRFPVGSQVSEQRIVSDFMSKNFAERTIMTVIHVMLRRGELQHRLQRKVLLRVR
ncbi:DNA replication licensing factor mcm5-like [Sycon ciliatum]|uniref:DNA replication licensing factor mcm5-like n=1 Tax=Sycon ciliatum TaxID=27933 RepID=UPI0020A846A4|eukprot:scpid43746/ scgid7831/ DNA replication licensing factor mcm5